MTTIELMTELEKRAGNDEVSRAALGFIQKIVGTANSLPNGRELLEDLLSYKGLDLDSVLLGLLLLKYGNQLPGAISEVLDR